MKTADLGLDTSSLYEAISRKRRQLGMSRLAVMKEVGTVSSTLTRLSEGYPPNAVTLLRICAWLGRDARDFIKREEDQAIPQIDSSSGPGDSAGDPHSVRIEHEALTIAEGADHPRHHQNRKGRSETHDGPSPASLGMKG